MLIFGRGDLNRPDLELKGAGLVLRPPAMRDFSAWAALRSESRGFLQPWEPLWPTDDLTRSSFRRRITRYNAEIQKDEAYPFFLFSEDDETLLGGVNLTNVRRGAASMASLGYWMGQRHAHKGLMTQAVLILSGFAFSQLSLRRIEASCVPENNASLRLLEKAGFSKEGYAREYLSINGVWRDHLLFAKLVSAPENLRV
jgi:[ribosomal protein S5]-alanine N-acetyltransferase